VGKETRKVNILCQARSPRQLGAKKEQMTEGNACVSLREPNDGRMDGSNLNRHWFLFILLSHSSDVIKTSPMDAMLYRTINLNLFVENAK
jgi:hypothetical protein